MTKKNPEKVFSTRIPEELQREFRSLVVLQGLTVSKVVTDLVSEYVDNYKKDAGKKLAQ